MFLTLLLVTFLVALAVSGLVARGFDRPIGSILARIIADDISAGWQRFVRFALLVVGISGGVRIYELERYIDPERTNQLELTTERWVLEVYRTVIETLQSLAWALLLFFMFALLAYVIVRRGEVRREVVERDLSASKPLI